MRSVKGMRLCLRIVVAVVLGIICLIVLPAYLEGQFLPTGPMVTPRTWHTATLLKDGRVLLVGGVGDWAMSDETPFTAELYDPSSKTFSPTNGRLRFPRIWHTATLLEDGRVLIAGGIAQGVMSTTSEIFDPSTALFSLTGAMQVPRTNHTSTLLPDGRVLVVGGTGAGGRDLASAEIYDPAAGTFSNTGSMARTRSGHAAVILPDGRVLVTGGYLQMDVYSVAHASAEIFDLATGQFTPAAPMTEGRAAPCASQLLSGQVLIAGGNDAEGGDFLSTAEIFDPSSGNFSKTGAMGAARDCGWAEATSLKNGKVLFTGAAGRTAEVYDPAARAFSFIGLMMEERATHTATLLSDGDVLLAGGYTLSEEVLLGSAELFHPAEISGVSDLRLVASTSPASPSVGDLVSVAVSLLNLGPDPARIVTVSVTVPSSMAYPQGPIQNCGVSDRWDGFAKMTCVIEQDISPNTTAQLTIPIFLFATGHFTASISTAASTSDPDKSNNDATVAVDVVGVKLAVEVRGNGTVTSAPAGISCSTSCTAAFEQGSTVTLTAHAAEGWMFSGWNGDCSGSQTCVVNMDSAHQVFANFIVPSAAGYTVSVTKIGAGNGVVTSTPAGISCGTICEARFTAQTQVTLIATASDGSVFEGWAGDCAGTGQCNVFLINNRHVSASFRMVAPQELPLSVALAGTGTGTVTSTPTGISCGTACLSKFNSGTQVTLTVNPANGSVFAGWSGDCSGDAACSVTMTAAHSVTATFNAILPSFDFGTPPASATVVAGGSALFSISVTGQGAFAGSVTFGCNGAPQGAVCNFNPASVNPGSGAATTVLTISTTPRTVAMRHSSMRFLFATLLPVFGLALLSGDERSHRRAVASTLTLLALATLFLGLSGCGGTAARAPVINTSLQGTPAGAYNVIVTATSGGVSRSQTVVLTVQ